MPLKISTDSSLFALTAAFALMDLISSTPESTLTKIFQKNDKDEYVFVGELYIDQDGNPEKFVDYRNNKKTITYPPGQYEKIQRLKKKKYDVNFNSKAEKLLKEMGFDFENYAEEFKPMFQNLIQSSLHRASEVLFWALLLERYFKFDTAQGVISFCYTLVRSFKFLSDYKVLRRDLLKLGRRWHWQLAWELALQHEKVKKFWEDKEKRGETYLTDWKMRCQQLAVNRWNEDRKHHIERMEEGARILRERFKAKFNSP